MFSREFPLRRLPSESCAGGRRSRHAAGTMSARLTVRSAVHAGWRSRRTANERRLFVSERLDRRSVVVGPEAGHGVVLRWCVCHWVRITPLYRRREPREKGVIVVTYNYRLGPLGWFSHPELGKESGHNASGNQGLMDAIAALKWVQKNIAAFGGDPENVTIFGESAGGTISAAMLASSEAKGLFHRVISESPFWMDVGMPLAQAEQVGRQIATTLGVTSLAELRAKTAEELLKSEGGAPIVDGWYIKEDLSIAFDQGRQHEADVLVGSNKDEGTLFLNAESAKRFGSAARERWGDEAGAFLKLLPAGTEAESQTSQLTAFRDEFSWQMRRWAELQAHRGKSRAYVYYFIHEPPAGSVPTGAAGLTPLKSGMSSTIRRPTESGRNKMYACRTDVLGTG